MDRRFIEEGGKLGHQLNTHSLRTTDMLMPDINNANTVLAVTDIYVGNRITGSHMPLR